MEVPVRGLFVVNSIPLAIEAASAIFCSARTWPVLLQNCYMHFAAPAFSGDRPSPSSVKLDDTHINEWLTAAERP
jgi:hypothetical protein